MTPPPRFTLPADFFSRYWQREPCVLRQAVPGYRMPLSPDELAGLACMDAVESRIVLERGGDSPWEVRHGPFDETVFAQLPDTHWTLLVQAVDHWDPDIAALKKALPAIPAWRFDDVMVSYASPGGGVGPHVDQYDVFLLQGLGRRRWQLGGRPDEDAPLREDTELNLLASFSATEEFVLEPGDALYLPPGIAHAGTAEDACVTVSIGFRAPAVDELIDAFGAYVSGLVPANSRYVDLETAAVRPRHPGEITEATLSDLLGEVRSELTPARFARWFGEFATAPKYPGERGGYDAEEARQLLASGAPLKPCLDCRFAFVERDDGLWLFADGRHWHCPPTTRGLIETLCDGRSLAPGHIAANEALVLDLLCCGAVEAASG